MIQVRSSYTEHLALSGTGNSPRTLKQGKINIIPMETCKNWYHERWDELFRFNLPYQAPVHEDFHVCLGNQDTSGRVSVCFVSQHSHLILNIHVHVFRCSHVENCHAVG